uniref:Odorant-binding protein 15 n=1 Tax=Yemma signatus TaxID=300820 RepID=A0A3G2GRT8_9HEMI|nr:odorant-binding protein 15 [Yemma signatus]
MKVVSSVVFIASSLVICNCRLTEEGSKLLREELGLWVKCAAQWNISESVLDGVLKKQQLPPTPQFKCFLSCHLKGMKIMDEDGAVSWDRVDEIDNVEIPEREDKQKALAATKICRETVPQKIGGDICETAYVATKCFMEETKKLNLRLLGPEDLA